MFPNKLVAESEIVAHESRRTWGSQIDHKTQVDPFHQQIEWACSNHTRDSA